jgi:hypothetical protein
MYEKVVTTLENIYTCFEKEAAAALIPNDIPSMRGVAATLKKINTFFRTAVCLNKNTAHGEGQILMGQNFCLWQWALPKHNFSIFFQNTKQTQKYYKQHLQITKRYCSRNRCRLAGRLRGGQNFPLNH